MWACALLSSDEVCPPPPDADKSGNAEDDQGFTVCTFCASAPSLLTV